MIEIINSEGRILELSAGTIIPVERNNSLFNSPDKFIQDLTYPGKAGLTENNIIFIKNGHLIESSNDVYELSVKVIVSGSPFFAGLFSYKIVSGSISFNLKVNFGAVATKVKNTSLRDIYTLDPDDSMVSYDEFEIRMKDTCINPLKYPCVFFPVKNSSWSGSAGGELAYKWLNYWNHENQKFEIKYQAGDIGNTAQVPFFRVSYILKKVLECLNFNVGGGYFTEPSAQNIYFFTRYRAFNQILPSLFYMPDLKIGEFLKQLAERLKISIDFDVLNNTVLVETPESVLSNSVIIDITNYIERIEEISTAESKGYSVTLKIDESDPAWNTGVGVESIFNPPYKLHIGSSETDIEMNVGTLNNIKETDYSYPCNEQEINMPGLGEPITWPLSLLEYNGVKDLGQGKIFPEAKPLNLNISDASWYKFLNDSKPLIIYANIPPELLSKMKATNKIECISNEGFNFVALPEQISYQLSNKQTELIRVKIKARPLISRYDTQAYIEVMDRKQITNDILRKYTAFYDPVIHGISQMRIEQVPLNGSAAVFGFTPVIHPTNDLGLGGTIGMNYIISGSRTDVLKSEARLYSDIPPKYYILGGIKYYCTPKNGYYSFAGFTNYVGHDGKPIWIIF